jgi:chemotaxis regulatin CheY-phosphate phosphatase CheZ
VVDGLLDIKERQMHILSALQFQDIVSQQTRAVQTLLERIERDLVGATTKEETTVSIDMTDGSFDPDASFDRDQAGADQSDIDKWIEEAGSDEKG